MKILVPAASVSHYPRQPQQVHPRCLNETTPPYPYSFPPSLLTAGPTATGSGLPIFTASALSTGNPFLTSTPLSTGVLPPLGNLSVVGPLSTGGTAPVTNKTTARPLIPTVPVNTSTSSAVLLSSDPYGYGFSFPPLPVNSTAAPIFSSGTTGSVPTGGLSGSGAVPTGGFTGPASAAPPFANSTSGSVLTAGPSGTGLPLSGSVAGSGYPKSSGTGTSLGKNTTVLSTLTINETIFPTAPLSSGASGLTGAPASGFLNTTTFDPSASLSGVTAPLSSGGLPSASLPSGSIGSAGSAGTGVLSTFVTSTSTSVGLPKIVPSKHHKKPHKSKKPKYKPFPTFPYGSSYGSEGDEGYSYE
ncbi:hypothetical protein MMC20_000927 [Loxospora ochrophaea]|nr:hypothetical protein [Loxospora ochrophaea]